MEELMPNMVQHYSIGYYPVLMLRPRTDVETPGSQVPICTLPGKCVHLGEEGCTLKREDMPIVCISSYCCSGGPDADKEQIHKGHLRDLWTSQTGQKIMALFEAASARENPSVELGYEALGRQMASNHDKSLANQEAAMDYAVRENALRIAMKEEARFQRIKQLHGARCQNCTNPASVACGNCGSLRFCSDVCASKCTHKSAPGHPFGCVRIDTEQTALAQKRAELM